MSVSPILELQHVTKKFRDFAALDDLSLAVQRGSIHGVLGEDGAGKTTLLRVIGGGYAAGTYTGQVIFEGRPLKLRAPVDAIREGIGIVLRKLVIFEPLSIAENVLVSQWHSGSRLLINQRATEHEAQVVLERWGIDLDPTAKARRLAPIEQRLLMIARALASEPRLVALDEPLYGISSPHDVSRILHIIRRMAEAGTTCLYMARRAAEASQIADYVTILRDGAAAGAWERASFDELAMTQAMISQRAGYAPSHIDEEEMAASGLFGSLGASLRRFFGPDS